MAKKLSDIEELVKLSSENFLEYIKRNVDVRVYSFLFRIAEVTDVYIFSGVIRNFFLQKEEIRDLDIVIRDDIDIRELIGDSISFRTNSFGGYKINISGINIDLWTLEKTWAIQYQKRLEFGVEDLYKFIPSTAFFNFSAVLFAVNEKRFYYKGEFLSFLRDKEINLVYIPNANYALCVLNTIYYADKYDLKISNVLKRFIIDLYKKNLNYTDIQLKHFGTIIYTKDDIKEKITSFKIERRQVGDNLTENLQEIFERLGLNKENGLYITQEQLWKTETAFPNRVKRLIERELKPDAFFCFDNKPVILFFDNPLEKYKLHKAIWNFNECPIAIILQNNIVEIFNGFEFDLKTQLLKKLGKDEKLSDFTYFELVTGKTWEQYNKNLSYKNRVDYNLLQNIKSARKVLVKQNNLEAKIANSIIGKAIFVRYLIDRKVKLNFDNSLRIWSNDEFCNLLDSPKNIYSFFEYLEDSERGFNGNLFPLTPEEFSEITLSDFQVIKRLLQGESIETGQQSLFNFYDFSIIPIEFISNVYELFIGQDNQKKDGAYYTPLFLVDYILKETAEKYLSNKSKNASDFSFCKVLDPACGSGIFLVETLRKIIEKYIVDTNSDVKSDEFKKSIICLAKENIYGIDKDSSAVQVAIFSIYLTLLDYLEPPSIENFKFPQLYNFNFFEADFFDEQASFNSVIKNVEFNFILGNPPWMRGTGEKTKPQYVQYIDRRRNNESTSVYKSDIGNKEIAQAFMLRSSDFSTKNITETALIVTSKVLYNLQSVGFRKYLLHNFFINQVFELAPVRREVFDKSNDKAIAPAVIIFFKYAFGNNTDKNLVKHIALKPSRFFSLFKIFTINRADFKTIEQNKLKNYDWLWKVLVYGSYLDFNFIKRLKENFPTIKDRLSIESDFFIGQGIMVGGGDKNDATELVGRPYIDTRNDIRQYWINPNNEKKWEYPFVHRTRNKELYNAPVLLISGGNNNRLECISAISSISSVYKSSLTGIRSNNKVLLREIEAILNSAFFAYYNLQTFSSTGIEREESHDDEKLNTPFSSIPLIDELAVEIENSLLKKYNIDTILEDYQLTFETDKKIRHLKNRIYASFDCSEQELDLLDYTNSLAIPLAMKHVGHEFLLKPIPLESDVLIEYASLFLNRFEKLNNPERKFVVEIWHTNQIIGMLFKMVAIAENVQSVIILNKQNEDNSIMSFLSKISSEQITDKLFVQKDVRGFEKDFFYLFKPNEKRLWHKAIGYLDVDEFADAILKEGRNRL